MNISFLYSFGCLIVPKLLHKIFDESKKLWICQQQTISYQRKIVIIPLIILRFVLMKINQCQSRNKFFSRVVLPQNFMFQVGFTLEMLIL